MASIRLGDLLVRAKVITDAQLKAALVEQQKWGGRLGELLVRMNVVTEDLLVKALSKQLNVPAVNLDQLKSVPAHVVAKLPAEIARDLEALPLQLSGDGKTLVVAMAEPQNLKHLDTLRLVSRCRITPQVAGRQAIARAFGRVYGDVGEVGDLVEAFNLVDAQGHTIIRSTGEVQAQRAEPPRGEVPAPPRRATGGEVPRTASLADVALPASPSLAGRSPAEVLRAIEEAQRKEVAALKAMIELLIEKGVFSRDEYLAKVKR